VDILKDLNPKQKEAVETISGPVLVVAGPGSGKTKTLTHRIAYLISKGARPRDILAVTFTNKAADEMKTRVAKLVAMDSYPPLIGTFHSVCARILRKEAYILGYTPNFTIYDEEDALKLIKNIEQDLSLDIKQFSPPKIRAIISSLKDSLVYPEDYEIEAEGPFYKEVHKVYAQYASRLKKQNAMDFDDLLMKTVELFRENPKVLLGYQSKFKYVLIDEFQDTNLSQYKIANYLAKRHRNLYCIGDLDQSIYSFRGADYRNILRFEEDWPDAKLITLEQNYRSSQNILDAATSVISKNTNRKEKNLWTKNGRGEAVAIKEAEDEIAEGEFIISQIEKYVRERGLGLKDFVVLYRTNAQSRAIEESLLRGGYPYKIIGGIKFYQRKEIKDVLAWLRLCLNKNDMMAMNRAHDMPAKFFRLPLSPVVSPSDPHTTSKASKINALISDFSVKSKVLNLTDFLRYIIKNIGFEEYLRDGTERGEERWDNVRELLSVSQKYDGQRTELAMRQLIEEAALAQETDDIQYERDLVTLMTLHAVKGLEFPVVFISGCEQGLLPHSRALFGVNQDPSTDSWQDPLEEERRLCYVGVTRAKEKLYLLFTRRRMMFGKTQSNPPSEFLRDIPERLLEFIPAEEEHVIELD
jgi:DNA helicase-2/ATP-dependent DNA helicase PcrA